MSHPQFAESEGRRILPAPGIGDYSPQRPNGNPPLVDAGTSAKTGGTGAKSRNDGTGSNLPINPKEQASLAKRAAYDAVGNTAKQARKSSL